MISSLRVQVVSEAGFTAYGTNALNISMSEVTRDHQVREKVYIVWRLILLDSEYGKGMTEEKHTTVHGHNLCW